MKKNPLPKIISLPLIAAVICAFSIYLLTLSTKSRASVESYLVKVQPDPEFTKGVSTGLWGVNFDTEFKGELPDQRYLNFLWSNLENIKKIGVKTIRFPGGCNANLYDLSSGIDNPQYRYVGKEKGEIIAKVGPKIDEVVRLTKAIGAELIFQANINVWGLKTGCKYWGSIYPEASQAEREELLVKDLKNILARFKDEINYIELGDDQWSLAGKIDPNEYLRVAKRFAQIIKSERPEIKVILVGYPSIDYLQNLSVDEETERSLWTNALKAAYQPENNLCGGIRCFDFINDKIYFTGGYSDPKNWLNPSTGKIQFILQTFLASDKKTLYHRFCPVDGGDNGRGILEYLCSDWKTEILPESVEAVKYFYFSFNGQDYLYRSLVNDLKQIETIRCHIDPAAENKLANCDTLPIKSASDYSQIAPENKAEEESVPVKEQEIAYTIKPENNDSYKSGEINSVIIKYNRGIKSDGSFGQETEAIFQVYHDPERNELYQRYCQLAIVNGEPQINPCGSWKKRDLTATFSSYNNAVVNRGQNQYLYEWLVDDKMRYLLKRDCRLNSTGKQMEEIMIESECGQWTKTPLIGPAIGAVDNASFVFQMSQEEMAPLAYNFPGINAYLADYNLSDLLDQRKNDYDVLPVLGGWNLDCQRAYSLSDFTHAHFIFTSILRLAEKGSILANIDGFIKNNCGLVGIGETETILPMPQTEAFSLTSSLAELKLYRTNIIGESWIPSANSSCVKKDCLSTTISPANYTIASSGLKDDEGGTVIIYAANRHPEKDASLTIETTKLPAAEIRKYKTGTIVTPQNFRFDDKNYQKQTIDFGDAASITLPRLGLARLTLSHCPAGLKPVTIDPCGERTNFRSYDLRSILGDNWKTAILKNSWINGKFSSQKLSRFRIKFDRSSCAGSFSAGQTTYSSSNKSPNYYDLGGKLSSYKNGYVRIDLENGASFGPDKKLYLCYLPPSTLTPTPAPTGSTVTLSPTVIPTSIPTSVPISLTLTADTFMVNSSTGKSCQQLCQEQGKSCLSVGLDQAASDNKLYYFDSLKKSCLTSIISNGCLVVARPQNQICSGHSAQWTVCRCR